MDVVVDAGRYHHGDLKMSLLNEATKIIRSEGEAALSMRRLASQLGVSRTAAYHHFADRDELLAAVAAEGFRRFDDSQCMQTVIDVPLTRDVLDLFARRYLEFADQNRQHYDLMFGSKIWKAGVVPAFLKEQAYASFKRYVDTVRRWHDEGAMHATIDPLRFAQVSWSTLHGLCRLLADGVYLEGDAAVDGISETLIDTWWVYLNHGASSPA
ncbi:TetR/AcrR family transcriptional regulator [bacterium]|nr:TetR/AcrR family transcriptional regulator [bacterium]